MANEPGTLLVEDAQIIFRNFVGKASEYNAPGQRNFCVLLDPKVATQLEKDGWNVKTLKARDEGELDRPYIQVAVRFDIKPPKVTMISGETRTLLTEETVSLLDSADIVNCDIIINPRQWEANGKRGIKAYLKTMFVTVHEDELEKKYSQGL